MKVILKYSQQNLARKAIDRKHFSHGIFMSLFKKPYDVEVSRNRWVKAVMRKDLQWFLICFKESIFFRVFWISWVKCQRQNYRALFYYRQIPSPFFGVTLYHKYIQLYVHSLNTAGCGGTQLFNQWETIWTYEVSAARNGSN